MVMGIAYEKLRLSEGRPSRITLNADAVMRLRQTITSQHAGVTLEAELVTPEPAALPATKP
jgi:hypothetical protein